MARHLFLISVLLTASALAASAKEALWLRDPAISPDGEQITFTYRGDLFRVPAAGGVAVPLTSSGAHDSRPVLSPDGAWLAFASNRYGRFDVFVMPSGGGEARRLTFHSADDFPTAFSADSREVLFNSVRIDDAGGVFYPSAAHPELYAVSIESGRIRQVLSNPALHATPLPAGGIVYEKRPGVEAEWRKHDTSSAAHSIWIWDGQEHRAFAASKAEDREPVVQGDSVFFLSERDGSFNVYSKPIEGDGPVRRWTHLERHPVRGLSASASGRLAFSWAGRLYTLDVGNGQRAVEPVRVAVEVRQDAGHPTRVRQGIGESISEVAVAPHGREVAFIARGDVFVASLEGTARPITETAGDERHLSWRPDGRGLVYAAERDGRWSLLETTLSRADEKAFFAATELGESPLVTADHALGWPTYSPDGKRLAWMEKGTELRVRDLAGGATRTLLAESSSFAIGETERPFLWTPDGRSVLARFLEEGHWRYELGLVAADGEGELVNTTRSGFDDQSPQWALGGAMMVWASDRDGLRSYQREGFREADVYAQFFTRAAWDRFRLSKEQVGLADAGAGAAGAEKEAAEKKGKDPWVVEPKAADPVALEVQGLEHRRRRLTDRSGRLGGFVISQDGETLFVASAGADTSWEIWKNDLREGESKRLTQLGPKERPVALAMVVDAKGEQRLLLATTGGFSTVDPKSGSREPIGLEGAEGTTMPAERRAWVFDHVARIVRDEFYDETYHGADWAALVEEYRPFLEHIDDDLDLAAMVSELMGELNASHCELRFRPSPPGAEETASLGLLYDLDFAGPGLKVQEVLPGGPGTVSGSRLAPGVVIEAIDGVTVSSPEPAWSLLDRRAGDRVRLRVRDPQSGETWSEVVVPINPAAEARLLYARWVESRRQATERLSHGRLGYVHVPSMNDGVYRTVFEEAFGRHPQAEGLVVDTRFNTGGDLVDDLSIFLSGHAYMKFPTRTPERIVGTETAARWTRPSIVIASEANYSDGHCFPWAYQKLGIGKVVGTPISGTCTFVLGERLSPEGLLLRIPFLPVTDAAGQVLERQELQPDVQVEALPQDLAAGVDRQLERAVAELLAQIGE